MPNDQWLEAPYVFDREPLEPEPLDNDDLFFPEWDPPELNLPSEWRCRECHAVLDEPYRCDNCAIVLCAEHIIRLDESYQYCSICCSCAECGDVASLVCPSCGELACSRHAGTISNPEEPPYDVCLRCCP